VLAAGLSGTPAAAQTRLHLSAAAEFTDVRPAPGGGAASEFGIEQIVARVAARTPDGRWRLWASLNAEGFTMSDGVLNLGAFGEGYADRRHPHTFVHELAVGTVRSVAGARVSLTVGKGFAAFGTDDPMHRPALKFPVNHHWAQIVERFVLITGVTMGPVGFEGTLFNGDEPERPEQWPALGRFADSWALRATVMPRSAVELQVSRAHVRSPEHRAGSGPDAEKWSASAAVTGRRLGGAVRALGEWAQTEEAGQRYTSLLAEVDWLAGGHRPYARIERTDRPEEERRLDPFETVRPPLDDHILGVTRWTIATVGYGHRLDVGRIVLEPLVEASLARVRETVGGLFDPVLFYGGDTLRSLTVAVRVHWGTASTMGRYGMREAEPDREEAHHH